MFSGLGDAQLPPLLAGTALLIAFGLYVRLGLRRAAAGLAIIIGTLVGALGAYGFLLVALLSSGGMD